MIAAAGLTAWVFHALTKLKPMPPPNVPCGAIRVMDPLPTLRHTEPARPHASARTFCPRQLQSPQPEPVAALLAILPLQQEATLVRPLRVHLDPISFLKLIITSGSTSSAGASGSPTSSSSASAASASSTGNAATSVRIGASTAGILALLMAALAL